MEFLDKVAKDLEKNGFSVGSSTPPTYWITTGNYVLNKIISGSFVKGLPQGRMVSFAGPSQSGKSFLLCNAMREAQKAGCLVVAIDTENALDEDFVSNIGVNTDPSIYKYVEADTIPETKNIVSKVIKGYKAEFGEDNPDAPKIFIGIDSLDMLMTETEETNFEKGISKGDQGQRNKQLKQMLREFVQSIKHLNITIATTSQVYRNQEITNGEGLWMISDATRYAPSQIVLITKLKLKEGIEVSGIKMKCEGYKTRFTKPFQTVTLEVPYETGMDPYNGLSDVAINMGVVEKRGTWKYFGEYKWNSSEVPSKYAEMVLKECEKKREQFLIAKIENSELDLSEGPNSKTKRRNKVSAKSTNG